MENADILALVDKRNEKRREAEKILDTYQDADGKIDAANAAIVDSLIQQAASLDDRIDEELKKKVINERRIIEPVGAGIDQFSGSYQKAGVSGKEYRQNFIREFRQGFKTAQNFLRESDPVQGGYLVPTEFDEQIVEALSEDNVMRQIGRIITTAATHKIPIVATKPAASWIAEGQNIELSNETFGQVILNAHKLAVAIKVSNELLQDSFYDLEAHLVSEFAKAISLAEEDAMINGGDSENCPKGILQELQTSPSTTITTTGADISVDDLLTLQYSLKRPYRRRAVWLVADSTMANIRRIKDNTGNFIWQPNLQEDEPPRLFGQPIYTSPFMPPMESGNVAVLYGDFADYFIIGERGQREVKPLRELYALSDQTAFLMIERIDAALTNLESVKALRLK